MIKNVCVSVSTMPTSSKITSAFQFPVHGLDEARILPVYSNYNTKGEGYNDDDDDEDLF